MGRMDGMWLPWQTGGPPSNGGLAPPSSVKISNRPSQMDSDEVNQKNSAGEEQLINDDDVVAEAEPSESANASSAQLTAADDDADGSGSQNLDTKPSTAGSNDDDAVVPAALPDIKPTALVNVSEAVASQLPATIPEEDQEEDAAAAPQGLHEILDPNHVRSK